MTKYDPRLAAASLMHEMHVHGCPKATIQRHKRSIFLLVAAAHRYPSQFRANALVFQIVYENKGRSIAFSFSKLSGQVQLIFEDMAIECSNMQSARQIFSLLDAE